MWPAEPAGRWHRAGQRCAAQMNGGHGRASQDSAAAQNPAYRLASHFRRRAAAQGDSAPAWAAANEVQRGGKPVHAGTTRSCRTSQRKPLSVAAGSSFISSAGAVVGRQPAPQAVARIARVAGDEQLRGHFAERGVAQLHVDVRRAPGVGHRPDGAKAQLPLCVALRAAEALERVVHRIGGGLGARVAVVARPRRHCQISTVAPSIARPCVSTTRASRPKCSPWPGARAARVLHAREDRRPRSRPAFAPGRGG